MSSIDEFLEELSAATPVPGGGSVAALQVAMGAALLAMVSNLTLGRKRYAAVEDQVTRVRDQALALCAASRKLVDGDIEAYTRVTEALSLPRVTEPEKQARKHALQEALKGAVQPPLETARTAARVLELGTVLATIGNKSAVSDVGTAVLAARAGLRAGLLNVEINLSGIEDQAWNTEIREKVRSIPNVDVLERDVLEHVRVAIGGAGQ